MDKGPKYSFSYRGTASITPQKINIDTGSLDTGDAGEEANSGMARIRSRFYKSHSRFCLSDQWLHRYMTAAIELMHCALSVMLLEWLVIRRRS